MSDAPDKADRPKRPVRDLIEGLGIALLMAIFYKYFAIEAYQIPTSSMQPTMMGSSSAGVYDRLIVDKLRYAVFEPERWDIAVFKYPIREVQNYVKRMVGMPGDRLRFAGGNVYRVRDGEDGSKPEHLETLRKPDRLQPHIWKEVFPARMSVLGGKKILGQHFTGRGGGEWTEDESVLRFKPRGKNARTSLRYKPPGADGLTNEVWDGYPTSIARKMREKEQANHIRQQVQDVRLAFDFASTEAPSELNTELRVELEADAPEGAKAIYFGFGWKDGKGTLSVRGDRETRESAEPVEVSLGAGATHRFRLTHVDDMLTMEIDGDEVARIDCDAHKILSRPRLVKPIIECIGGGELTVSDIVVERDLHYVSSTREGANSDIWPISAPDRIIEVPEGHYMALGDNTLQSVDSRDWTSITIGVEDNRVVDPKTHPNAKRLRGNMRAMPLANPPDPDENPVIVRTKGKVVFTDDAGEVHTLDGQVNTDGAEATMWGVGGAWFQDAEGNPWHPETALVQFVPREHIIGRPLINFWPVFSPFRFGLIR